MQKRILLSSCFKETVIKMARLTVSKEYANCKYDYGKQSKCFIKRNISEGA